MRRRYFVKIIYAGIAATVMLLCAGCSPRITVSVSEDGSARFDVSAGMGKIVERTVRSITVMPEGQSFFDTGEIRQSLLDAGVKSVSVVSKTGVDLEVSAAFDNADDASLLINGFFALSSLGDGRTELSLCLSPDILAEAFSKLPPETAGYVDLLMAPVFTGESMTADEYVSVIAAVYGSSAAAELSAAVLTLTMTVPSAILQAESGFKEAKYSIDGKTAVLKIPFASFLTKTGSVSFRVSY